MSLNKLHDIKIAAKAVLKLKNWPIYFLDYLSLISKKDVVYKYRNGAKFSLRAKTTDRGIMTSIVISDEHKIKSLELPKNATIMDIGAQTGIFSVYVSNKAKKVYAYEPEPENYKYLVKNIELNNLQNKIIPFNLAISDKKEKLKMYCSKENTGGHSMYLNSKSKYVTVNAISLKDAIVNNKISKIDLLKIDTEGAEYKMLFGLPQNYFKKINMLIVEYHNINHEKYNKENLVKFLKKTGYAIEEEEGYLFCTSK